MSVHTAFYYAHALIARHGYLPHEAAVEAWDGCEQPGDRQDFVDRVEAAHITGDVGWTGEVPPLLPGPAVGAAPCSPVHRASPQGATPDERITP